MYILPKLKILFVYCIAHVRHILHETRSPRVHPRGEPDYTPIICLSDFYFFKSLNIIFYYVVDLKFKYYFFINNFIINVFLVDYQMSLSSQSLNRL